MRKPLTEVLKSGVLIGVLVQCATASLAHAGDYYKWTDAQGTVHYSQTPPSDHVATELFVDDNATTAPPPGMDYRLRTAAQKTRAQSDQAALQKTDAAAVSRDCTAARQNMTKLQTHKPLAPSDATDVRALTPEQRQQAMTEARAQAEKFCSRK